ncbi:uncharacterized protein LOC111916151 isoform X1 [Lactuca sativa]|nr:uncharacterized protein LOC111916151 isoform X1 [Lactuca sativa]
MIFQYLLKGYLLSMDSGQSLISTQRDGTVKVFNCEEDQLCDYNHIMTPKPSGKSEKCSGFESSPSYSFLSPGVLKEIDEIIYRRTKKKLEFMDENSTGTGIDICSSASSLCSPYMNKIVSIRSKITDIEIDICKSILCSNRNLRETIWELKDAQLMFVEDSYCFEANKPISCNVIDCWSSFLNIIYTPNLVMAPSRVFFHTKILVS